MGRMETTFQLIASSLGIDVEFKEDGVSKVMLDDYGVGVAF